MPAPNKTRLSVQGVASDLLPGVDITPASEEVSLHRVSALTQRIRQIVSPPPPNKYKASFLAFLQDCCYTIDEGRGGKIGRFPAHYPFIADLVEALHICPMPLMIEKSRRVLASWTVYAWDVWLAAGGQDSRWVNSEGEAILLNNDGYRQVFLVTRKYEDSCRYLHRRVKPICEFFEKYGCRELWPDFPRPRWNEGEATFENGSVISAVAQGADQLRGPGATHVHCEEFSFWEQAQRTLSGLIPTTAGGGHVTLITTALAGSYAADVRNGTLKGGWQTARQRLLETRLGEREEEEEEEESYDGYNVEEEEEERK